MTLHRKPNRPLWIERTALECKCHRLHRPEYRSRRDAILARAGLGAQYRMAEIDQLSKPLREEVHAIGRKLVAIYRAPPSLMVNGPPKPQARGNFALCKRGQRLALKLGIRSAKIIELHHELSLEDLGL